MAEMAADKEASWTQKHFTKSTVDGTFKCNLCSKAYNARSGVTVKKKHMLNKHGAAEQTKPIESYFTQSKKSSAELITDFVVNGQHSIAIVEEDGFKR